MARHLLWFAASIILSLPLLPGCSSRGDGSTTDVILCWLRPSCLPSSLPHTTRASDTTASREARARQGNPVQAPKPASPSASVQTEMEASFHTEQPLRGQCHAMAWAVVKPDRASLTVQYQEPTTQQDGSPLKDLMKTSIYTDLGGGFVKIRDIPASSPSGGGMVKETIPLNAQMKLKKRFKICVTATDRRGLEN